MRTVKQIIKVIIIFYVIKIAATLISEVLTIVLHFPFGLNPLKGELFTDPLAQGLMGIFGFAVMTAIPLLYWKLIHKKSLPELGVTKRARTYLIGIIIGTVLITVSAGAALLTGSLQYHGLFAQPDVTMILMSLGGFVFQGAYEELMCRGVVQQLMLEKTSVPAAVGVSALLFTVPHLPAMIGGTPSLIVLGIYNLIVLSILMSLITLLTKSIWAACALHTIWNFILYNIMGLNLSGTDVAAAVFDIRSAGSNILNGGEYGIEASIITAAVLTAAAGLFFVIYRKKSVKSL